jgi:hypothetical protein
MLEARWPMLKRLPFSIDAGDDPQELIAAVEGKIIRVIFADFEIPEGAAATLYSGDDAAIGLEAERSRVWQPCYAGWCETAKGGALKLLVTGGTVKGLIGYIED